MPDDDNTTNLPILDDIIKHGDADKAIHPPSSKVQTSKQPGNPAQAPSSASHLQAADAPGLTENQVDSIERMNESQPDDTTSNRPDIDRLTEEIMDGIRDEMEQLLRRRIRNTLKQHFPDSGEFD